MFKYSDKEIEQTLKDAIVICDTREQKNEHIIKYFDSKKIPYIKEKLEYGDYTLKVKAQGGRDYYLSDTLTIERKANLEELSNNLAHERERMIAEFSRKRGRMLLLIENAEYEDIINHNYKSQYQPKSFMATLKTFEDRYSLSTHFQKNIGFSGSYIYMSLIYALRNRLKEGLM